MDDKKKKKWQYVDRDVSWMYFNHRILQEASKQDLPPLERLSFLGIYSNNLDEFFRVRMASLSRLLETDDKSMRRQVAGIKKTIATINRLNATYSQEYAEAIIQVFGELEKHHIRMLDETQLNETQQQFIRRFFQERLNGYTNPIWFDEIKDIAQLEDNRIYLLVKRMPLCHDGEKMKHNLAIIKLPDKETGRFVMLP